MNYLPNFIERLKELMLFNNYNARTLALKLGVEPSTITRLLSGERAPTVNTLVAVADLFNCSCDYLLGKQNDLREDAFNRCPPIGERIKKLVESKGLTGYAFCKQCAINESRYYDWINGKHIPNVDSLVKIANALNCSVDFILGREK